MKTTLLLILFFSFSSCDQKVDNNKVIVAEEIKTASSTEKLEQFVKPFVYQPDRSIEEYGQILNRLYELKSLDSVENSLILEYIPVSLEEYKLFYEKSYSKDKSVLERFDNLNQLIFRKTTEGDCTYLNAYVKLSIFVDGEFAETYFDNLDFVAMDRDDFCECTQMLSENNERLRAVIEELCQ
jgi:hypothetical protein